MSPIRALIESPPLPHIFIVPLILSSCLILFLIVQAIYNLTLHPLAKIPGPLLARITPFYPIYRYYRGDFAPRLRELHARHGAFVRIAPNHIAVAGPATHKQIGTAKGLEKGDFYDAFVTGISRNRDLFTIRHNALHSRRKRISGNIWSMTSVLETEAYIDGLIALFNRKMARAADAREPVDLGLWTWRFTYDVIGELFFGRAWGFLELERDVDGLMASTGSVAPFEGMIGMAPAWSRPFLTWGLGAVVPGLARGFGNMRRVKVASKRIVRERMDAVRRQEETRGDMLGRLLSIVWEKGEKFDWSVEDVEQECQVAMVAGNDTVAITLTVILYHLAANPASLARLQRDLDAATADGTLSSTIRYKEAIGIPYLNAVVDEGFRVHPLLSYPAPRIVPKGGAEIGGRWWPEGTALGTSCGVMEMDATIFGENPESWRPERWLVDSERHARMWDNVCGFGAGQRACIGQNIARCEILKFVPQFLREFDVETTSEWRTFDRWFNKPQDIYLNVKRRNKA